MTRPRLRYFTRKHKTDIISTIAAVIGSLLAYKFAQQPGTRLTYSILVVLTFSIINIYLRTRERDFYFIPLRGRKEKDDWAGEGKFDYDKVNDAYIITNSYSGFIFTKALTWSDYKLEFDFKIDHASVGAIVRATNLSNLIMFQIFPYGVKAHIRINGFWLAWEPQQTQLKFGSDLNLNHWHKCILHCNKGSIHIVVVAPQGEVLSRDWQIPTGPLLFTPQLPKEMESRGNVPLIGIPFPINLEYGTIGFRNDGAERAAVRNVLVEKLP